VQQPTALPRPGHAWRAPALLFLGFLIVYAATIGTQVSLDVWTADYAAWSIVHTGHGWLDLSSVPKLDNNPLRAVWVVQAAHGHEAIGRAPGVIVPSLPAYWIAGLDTMSVVPGALTAALLTALADVLLFLSLRGRMGQRSALLATVVFGLTTPVWSIAANGMWPHTLTVLGIAGMAWSADRDRWWLVGLFGGVALWGRLHAALICAVLAVALAAWRRDPRIAVKAGSVGTGALLMLSAWNRWMYGTWDPTAAYRTGDFTSYAGAHRLNVVNHLGFWISPDRGLLVWSPMLIVLAAGLFRGWRDLPDWSQWLLVGGLAYQLLQGALNRFSGGEAFYGYRLGLEFLACAAPALALSAHRLGPLGQRLLVPVGAAQFAMIAAGACGNSYFVPADEVWTHNSFVEGLRVDPTTFGTIAGLSLCAAFLFARIWRNPQLERPSGRVDHE
jgi:alpha-1,2-mannosyltransferase